MKKSVLISMGFNFKEISYRDWDKISNLDDKIKHVNMLLNWYILGFKI